MAGKLLKFLETLKDALYEKEDSLLLKDYQKVVNQSLSVYEQLYFPAMIERPQMKPHPLIMSRDSFHQSRYDILLHKKLILTLLELINLSKEMETNRSWCLDVTKATFESIECFNHQVAIATVGMTKHGLVCTLADMCDVIVLAHGKVLSWQILQTEPVGFHSTFKEWAVSNYSFIDATVELIAGTTSLLGKPNSSQLDLTEIKNEIFGKIWQEVSRQILLKLESSLNNEPDIEKFRHLLMKTGK